MTATSMIAIYAAAVSTSSVGWQVFTWRRGRAFDVRVTVEAEGAIVASGKYEITVMARNLGATHEAVQEIWLQYAEHDYGWQDEAGFPSVRARLDSAELAPHRNVRRSFDLLGSRFVGVPSELVAVVLLESGKFVRSDPFQPSQRGIAAALAGKDKEHLLGDADD